MTLFAQTVGQRQTAAHTFVEAGDHDLMVCETGSALTLESFIATNNSGSERKVDLIYDAGSPTRVLHQYPVPVGEFIHVANHNLPFSAGGILRVASDGAGLSVSAVYIQNHPSQRQAA